MKASDGPGGGSAWFDGRSDATPHPGEFAYAFAPDFDEWPDDLAEAFGMRGGAGS